MNSKIGSNKLRFTKHGAQRMQQRGILKAGINTILQYGSEVRENEFLLRTGDIDDQAAEIKFEIELLTNAQKKHCGRLDMDELSSEERARKISALRKGLKTLFKNRNKKIVTSEMGIVTGYTLTKRSQKTLKKNRKYKKW